MRSLLWLFDNIITLYVYLLIASAVLQTHAPAALQAAWLPRIAGGEAIVVLAHIERGLDLRTHREYGRAGWHIASETTIRQTATATHFRIQARLDAFENGARVFSRRWDEEIPRDLV